MRIGFVGLGKMGRPMAVNLVKAGHEVTVHNRSLAAVNLMVSRGAKAAASPAAVAQAVEVLLTSVPDPEDVERVYLGPKGALETARSGQIFIDTSTVDPMTSRRIGEALAAKGVAYLDAPVSGGPKGAETGTLTIMVGGDPKAFARAKPVLDALGKKIYHLGPVGAGSTAKLCNQLLGAVTHALIGEVMVLGTKAGMEPRTLYEALRNSSGQSYALDRAVPNFILPGNFEPAFTVEGSYKDLECAIRTAKALGVRMLLAPIGQQCFEEARALGHAQKDAAAVILPMETLAGVQVRDRAAKPA